jgi:hypothetical protein
MVSPRINERWSWRAGELLKGRQAFEGAHAPSSPPHLFPSPQAHEGLYSEPRP